MRNYMYLSTQAMRHPRLSDPLFWFLNNLPVLTRDINAVLQSFLRAAGHSTSGLTNHSLRKGVAATLLQGRTPDLKIKWAGRWRSSTYLRYLDNPSADLASLAATMATE